MSSGHEEWSRKQREFESQQYAENMEKAEQKRLADVESEKYKLLRASKQESTTPKVASSAAKIAAIVGWALLFLSMITFSLNIDYAPILGLTIPLIALILGVFSLVLSYWAERVAEVLGAIGLVVIYLGGRTPEGFQLSAVPLNTWGIFILLIIVGVSAAYFFRRE